MADRTKCLPGPWGPTKYPEPYLMETLPWRPPGPLAPAASGTFHIPCPFLVEEFGPVVLLQTLSARPPMPDTACDLAKYQQTKDVDFLLSKQKILWLPGSALISRHEGLLTKFSANPAKFEESVIFLFSFHMDPDRARFQQLRPQLSQQPPASPSFGSLPFLLSPELSRAFWRLREAWPLP